MQKESQLVNALLQAQWGEVPVEQVLAAAQALMPTLTLKQLYMRVTRLRRAGVAIGRYVRERPYAYWDAAAQRFIEENHDRLTPREMARALNRTPWAVYTYLHRQGLHAKRARGAAPSPCPPMSTPPS